MTQTTTRRDLLRFGTSAAAYAAGAAIVTGGVAIASEAKGALGISPALAKLLADRSAADETVDRWAAQWNAALHRVQTGGGALAKADLETLSDREDAVYAPVLDCDDAIEAFPCTTLSDLHAKMEHIGRTGSIGGNSDAIYASLLADVRRLTGEGR